MKMRNILKKASDIFLPMMAAGVLVSCGGGSSPEGDFPVDNPGAVIQGVTIANPDLGHAEVGVEYKTKLNTIISTQTDPLQRIEVVNLNATGGGVSVDLQGNLTWVPNDVDFLSGGRLQVQTTTEQGVQSRILLSATVIIKRGILQVTLSSRGGTYSDKDGLYLIKVTPSGQEDAKGVLIVSEIYDRLGMLDYEVKTVNSASSIVLEVLDAPVIPPRSDQFSTQADEPYPLKEFAGLGAFPFAISTNGAVVGRSRLGGANGFNVYTSRTSDSLRRKLIVKDGELQNIGAESHQVFKFFSNCLASDLISCQQKAKNRAPVLLIHGFAGTDNISGYGDAITGGGSGTWGTLPNNLIARQHPVFEMRWHTYMRFEEAAGKLEEFSRKIANYTGVKPIILAHSFGGVVSHLMLESQGLQHDGNNWMPAAYSGQLSKLITLNSPLSGINGPGNDADSPYSPRKIDSNGNDFLMVDGVDGGDRLISMCYAITCFQAGHAISASSLVWNSVLIAHDGPISDKFNLSVYGRYVGESISRLQNNIGSIPPEVKILSVTGFGASLHDGVISNVVTPWQIPSGDGLISLLGQSLSPSHFAFDPFALNSVVSYKFAGQSPLPLYSSGDGSVGRDKVVVEEMMPGDCVKYTVPDRKYLICAQSTHTDSKRSAGSDLSIANLGSEDSNIIHPLKTIVADGEWVGDESPEVYASACAENDLQCFISRSKYKGSLVYGVQNFATQASSPVRAAAWTATFTDKTTGQARKDFSAAVTNDAGEFEIDVEKSLKSRFHDAVNLENYTMELRISISGYEPVTLGFDVIENGVIDLGTIELKPVATTVSVVGRVIDAQTVDTGVSGAIIRFAMGRDMDATSIRQKTDVLNVGDSRTSRRVESDLSGGFGLSGLRPGEYSVLVTKPNYLDQLQGRVTISAGGQITLSMLREQLGAESSITLRWENANAGADVSRDLDSHLLRLNQSGGEDYHIYFGNKVATNGDALDRDDTDYEGPETITFTPASGLNYVYFVHDYSGNGTIVGSQARVTVRYAGITQTFRPPTSTNLGARFWRVFDIVNGQLRRCQVDCLLDAPPAGLTTQAGSSLLPVQWQDALTRLPNKQ